MEAFGQPLSTETITASYNSPNQQHDRPDASLDPGMLDSHPSAFVSDGELRSFVNLMTQSEDKFQPLGPFNGRDCSDSYDTFNGYDTLPAGKVFNGYTDLAPTDVMPSEMPMPDYVSPPSLALDEHRVSSATNIQLGDLPQPTQPTQPAQAENPVDKDTEKPQPEPPRRRGRPRKAKQNNPSYSSKPNNTATAPPPPPPASESTTTSQDHTSGEQDEEPDADKKRLRARNRESAKRFRIRKRDGIERLREKEEQAKKTNERLVEEATKLRDETLELKTMVLGHAGCGCPFIEEYIENMAANLAQKTSPNYTEPQTGTSPSVSASVSVSNDASMTDLGE